MFLWLENCKENKFIIHVQVLDSTAVVLVFGVIK